MAKFAKQTSARVAIGFIVAAGLLVSISLQSRAQDQCHETEGASSNLATNLVGAWTLVKAQTPGNPSGIGTRLKYFTGTHWMITQPDPKTGQVVFHHGGHYMLDGDVMMSSVDFANENTASRIGTTSKYRMRVDGNKMYQQGLGNEFTEEWERAK